MYCYVHIHHNGQLISFVIQPRETSDLKAMYGDLRKYLFNITSHLDTTYFDMVKEEACIIKPRPSFPAYQIKQEGNSTKNTTNRCAAFHYEGSRSRTAIFNYLAPPDSELVSESFSHHTTHIMCMERHFQTQWWRDLFRCRIDLLNFSMGFNIVAPYMEFPHLNWYIAEWTRKRQSFYDSSQHGRSNQHSAVKKS